MCHHHYHPLFQRQSKHRHTANIKWERERERERTSSAAAAAAPKLTFQRGSSIDSQSQKRSNKKSQQQQQLNHHLLPIFSAPVPPTRVFESQSLRVSHRHLCTLFLVLCCCFLHSAFCSSFSGQSSRSAVPAFFSALCLFTVVSILVHRALHCCYFGCCYLPSALILAPRTHYLPGIYKGERVSLSLSHTKKRSSGRQSQTEAHSLCFALLCFCLPAHSHSRPIVRKRGKPTSSSSSYQQPTRRQPANQPTSQPVILVLLISSFSSYLFFFFFFFGFFGFFSGDFSFRAWFSLSVYLSEDLLKP